jgi:hypothetical protein
MLDAVFKQPFGARTAAGATRNRPRHQRFAFDHLDPSSNYLPLTKARLLSVNPFAHIGSE